MKRLALYVFWEKNGIVRDFVIYYLSNLRKVSEILVIVNGQITDESREKIEKIGCKVMVRENHGLDFGAWNDAIKSIGFEKIRTYDQLILCNCTCYGPIFPFEEMFNAMAQRDCDFWGITKHPTNKDIFLIPGDGNTQIIEHIQSFFIVFKNIVLQSSRFEKYWTNFREYTDYMQEVCYHEIKFTKFFEDAGFKSDSYIALNKYESRVPKDSILFFDILNVLKHDRIPVIKRKLFSEYKHLFNRSLVRMPNDVFNYLKDETDYPVDYIWQDLIATQKMSDLKKIFHLNYILSEQTSKPSSSKIALVCYAYYPDTVDYMQKYIESMPNNADVYIISSKMETLDSYALALEGLKHGEYNFVDTTIQNATTNNLGTNSNISSSQNINKSHIFHKTEYRLKSNDGRDVSAYLITAKDVLTNYDYICCIHDKKSPQLSFAITVDDFNFHCLECSLHSKNYVNNLISTFEKNSRLGLLVPPSLYFGPFACFGAPLNANVEWYNKLHQMLNISIPYDDNPMAPFGSIFWIRGAATKTLFSKNWKYKDFPKEPLPVDSTISHAIERIYPSVAQNDGFYTSIVMPNSFAELYYSNTTENLYNITQILFSKYGVQNPSTLLRLLDEDRKHSQTNNTTEDHKVFKLGKYYKYKMLNLLTLKKVNKIKSKYKMLKARKRELRVKF